MPINTTTRGVPKTRSRKARVRDDSDGYLVPGSEVKLPHERDESPQARNTSNPVTRQAHRDAASGQRDTDLRGGAVDSFRRATGTRAKTGTRAAGTRPPRKSPVS